MGWFMSPRMPAGLVIKTLEMAMERRGYPRGVIYHSDQGSQYTSQLFKCHVEAKAAVLEYIEGVYNTRRRHRRPNHLSPVEFEMTVAS